jgi:hypothetical protein
VEDTVLKKWRFLDRREPEWEVWIIGTAGMSAKGQQPTPRRSVEITEMNAS